MSKRQSQKPEESVKKAFMRVLVGHVEQAVIEGRPMTDIRADIVRYWAGFNEETRREIATQVREDLSKMKAVSEAIYQEFFQASIHDDV